MSIRLENGARAQIELDLDNTRESNTRMSERYYLEDRYKIEGRLVLIGPLENEVQTEDEAAILSSYKDICQKILTERLHISKHKREIKHYEQVNQNAVERNPYQKSDYGKTMIGFSEREISKATASLNDLEQQALNLEKNEVIQKLYYRAYVAAAAESKYDLAKLLEERRSSFERPQPSPTKKQETIKESKTPPFEPEAISAPPKEEPKNERKILDMLTSKRIAAVISILLCVFLYFALLTTAFSAKVNTYICYTQSKDDQFHDITCWHLKGNSVEETTVYHVSDSHVRCEYCKPSDRITITERNYIIPIFISAPISAAVYLLLTYKKKQ